MVMALVPMAVVVALVAAATENTAARMSGHDRGMPKLHGVRDVRNAVAIRCLTVTAAARLHRVQACPALTMH
jgi:hypothetical protein